MEVIAEEGRKVDGEYEAMVWQGHAMAITPCAGHPDLEYFGVGIEAKHPNSPEKSVRVLSDLIQPFMESVMDGHHGCRDRP